MNPFDDTLPEERQPQYQVLTTMLQQASRKPVFVTPDRQARMLAEVRGLLESTASQRVAGQDGMNMAQFHAPQLGGGRRQHRFSRLVTLIAAVLVIGALIVTDLLIFHPWTSSTSRPPMRPDRFVVSSAELLAKDYSLNGVAALSSNDIWVIGDNPIRRPPRPQALFKHWNGSQWIIYPDPASETQTVSLRAIAAASPSDVWAVGSVEGSFQSLIQHWNGSRWSVVPSPPIGNQINEHRTLVSITAIAANDAWAVGDYSPGGSVGDRALIEHWNGTRWSMIPSPHPGIGSRLLKVEAISANDVWAVGSFAEGFQGQTLTLHWDGSQWNVVKSPNPGKAGNELSSVTIVSAHDIWAVGSFSNSTQGQTVEEPFFVHWDGSQWSVVESPGLGNSYSHTLSDVAALSTNDVWAVGYKTDSNGNSQTLIEYWDGTHWSVVKSPDPTTNDALYGMEHVPHSNNIIVVGTMYYSTGETGTVLYITSLGGEALLKH
jgi:hypothetical protein